MKYSIGMDIGSTNVKGILRSEEGEIAATASEKFEYDTPKQGYVEIPASRFADKCFGVLSSLAQKLPKGGELVGISQVSASGNLLLLGENDEPLTPIYNWQDLRVTSEVETVLGADFDYDAYYEKIGWRLGVKFPLAQLCYLKHHTPSLLEGAGKILMSTEYFNYLLTGKLGLSPSAGTPFFLIDQRKKAYDQEILKTLGIPEEKLPPILPVGALLGEVKEEICESYGIPRGTKVFCGTFDHPGGAISTGVTEEGKALLSCGTSWVAFIPIRDRTVILKNRFLCDPFLSDIGGPYGAMCSISSIGNTVSALVDTYIGTGKDQYERLSSYAEASKNGSGGLIIDPNDIRNAEILHYSKENIAYAIMEMPARLLREKLDIFLESGVQFDTIFMAGGPTRSRIWVEITKKVTGLSVTVSNAEYAGAVGAAMLAIHHPEGI